MDMVERAGRAVEKILWPHDSTPYASGGKAEAIARAVIEAMREPTDAMLIDGAAKIRNFTWTTSPYPRTRAVWISMIDASLTNNPVFLDSLPGPLTNEEQKR